MQWLRAVAELVDIVGLGVEAAVAVVDVENVAEIAAAAVAVSEEAAECVGGPLFLVERQSALNCELQRPMSIVLKVVLLTARFWLDIGQQKMGCWPLWRETTRETLL